MMNGNEGEFNHWLDHVADMLQDPANIKATGHVVQRELEKDYWQN